MKKLKNEIILLGIILFSILQVFIYTPIDLLQLIKGGPFHKKEIKNDIHNRNNR